MVHAYHNLCKACAEKRNVCAKCTNSDEIVNQEEPDLTRELEAKLKTFKERTRRTLVRKLDKGEIQPAEVLEMEVKPKRSQIVVLMLFCGRETNARRMTMMIAMTVMEMRLTIWMNKMTTRMRGMTTINELLLCSI